MIIRLHDSRRYGRLHAFGGGYRYIALKRSRCRVDIDGDIAVSTMMMAPMPKKPHNRPGLRTTFLAVARATPMRLCRLRQLDDVIP